MSSCRKKGILRACVAVRVAFCVIAEGLAGVGNPAAGAGLLSGLAGLWPGRFGLPGRRFSLPLLALRRSGRVSGLFGLFAPHFLGSLLGGLPAAPLLALSSS